MAFVHGKNSRLLLGVAAFSGFLNSFENSSDIELGDTTVFGDEGHRFLGGLESGALSIEGHLDNVATAGGQDETLNTALNNAAGTVITSAVGGFTVGNRVIAIEARETNYAVSTPVADKVSVSASWQSEGQLDRGVSLGETTSAAVGPVNGTAVDNAALTTTGAAAYLHVTANTFSGTSTVKVQHSVDNSVWVDLITFTVVGIATKLAERKTVAGTVNRYLRMTRTSAGAGSITYAVAAARR